MGKKYYRRKRIIVVTETGQRRMIKMNEGRWTWLWNRYRFRGMQSVWDGLGLLAGVKLAPEERQPLAEALKETLENWYWPE